MTYAKPRRRSISVASCRKNGNWQIGRIAASQSTSQPRGLLAGNRLRPGGASFYQQIPDESSPITKRYAPRFFFVSLKSAGTMAWFCSFDLSTGSAASVARVFAKIPKARRAVLARVMHGDQWPWRPGRGGKRTGDAAWKYSTGGERRGRWTRAVRVPEIRRTGH